MYNIGDVVSIKKETRRADFNYENYIVDAKFLVVKGNQLWNGFSKDRFELLYKKVQYYFY